MDVLRTIRAALLFTLCGFLLAAASAYAQTSNAGARDAALAGASSAVSASDLWSEANPAGWSQLGAFAAGINVAELYGLDELRLGAVQASFGLRKASVIAGARTLGYEDYRETALTAGLGRSFRWGTYRPLHAGVRLRFHHAAVRSYGSAAAYAATAGVIVPIAQGTDLGLAAENLIVFTRSLGTELPRRLHAGLSISAGSLTLLAGASKDVRTPLASRFGIEAHPTDAFSLRLGYSLEPPRFAGGIGLRLLPLTIDLAAERHFVLGWTPSCSVGMRW